MTILPHLHHTSLHTHYYSTPILALTPRLTSCHPPNSYQPPPSPSARIRRRPPPARLVEDCAHRYRRVHRLHCRRMLPVGVYRYHARQEFVVQGQEGSCEGGGKGCYASERDRAAVLSGTFSGLERYVACALWSWLVSEKSAGLLLQRPKPDARYTEHLSMLKHQVAFFGRERPRGIPTPASFTIIHNSFATRPSRLWRDVYPFP